jgi:gamma-glutamylcyclotransferase (GGCT)/AIG2-like uncharacterized protein YtfP
MKELLFVYGSLKKAEVQKKLLGIELAGQKDILKRWKKTTILVKGQGLTILVPDDKSVVFGEVVSVDSDDWEKIDDFQTMVYRRIRTRLESGKEAWVYVKQ